MGRPGVPAGRLARRVRPEGAVAIAPWAGSSFDGVVARDPSFPEGVTARGVRRWIG
jgi:hypothetical protein